MSRSPETDVAARRLAIYLDCERESLTLAELLERALRALEEPIEARARRLRDELSTLEDELAEREDRSFSLEARVEDVEAERDAWRDVARMLATVVNAPESACRRVDDLRQWAEAIAGKRRGLVGLASRAAWMQPEHIMADLAVVFDDAQWAPLAEAVRNCGHGERVDP